MSEAGKPILIIGNAPITEDISAEVETYTRVVRFNFCAGMPTHLGRKCTDLWLSARGRQAHKLAHSQLDIDPRQLHSLVITDPEPNPIAQRFFRLLGRRGNLDHGDALMVKFAGAQTSTRITALARQQLLTELLRLGRPDCTPRWPSSGTQAIAHFAASGRPVHIIGFGFQGWKRHPWPLEQRYVAKLQAEGKLSYLA
ncbi:MULTISPECIES: hypothetical protein [unclassified Pseudoalteromonas]|uniref:hypothetical protein n=1 Tax=unclassified Pseudoalteromonas TaxID=194690 RepID=UPI000CF70B85|nr:MULTISPECIES: hypothetical protein [unclassified Pseudoalteromonas]MBS3797149.1 hypothetical protein [Pseudoalteromonas sp. BDTF-M6]